MAAVAHDLRIATNEPEGRITKGCELRGRIEYDGSLRIQGLVEGEILARDEVIIEGPGVARARIQAHTIRVAGVVEGDIQAKGRVEIAEGGEVLGDIVTPSLKIADGGVFEGRCKMGKRQARDGKR